MVKFGFLKILDKSPTHVGLKYKDDFSFGSRISGCLTLITILLAILAIVSIFISVLNKETVIASRKVITTNSSSNLNLVQMPIGKGMIWAIGV